MRPEPRNRQEWKSELRKAVGMIEESRDWENAETIIQDRFPWLGDPEWVDSGDDADPGAVMERKGKKKNKGQKKAQAKPAARDDFEDVRRPDQVPEPKTPPKKRPRQRPYVEETAADIWEDDAPIGREEMAGLKGAFPDPDRPDIVYRDDGGTRHHGMPLVEAEYVRFTDEKIIVDGRKQKKLRHESLEIKRDFLRMLATHYEDELRVAFKLNDNDIQNMREEGWTPEHMNVHHKLPLAGVGDPEMRVRANDFDNLVLIRKKPHHQHIHEHLDPQIETMKVGERRRVNLLRPAGMWFSHLGPKPPTYDEHVAKHGPWPTEPSNQRALQAQAGNAPAPQKPVVKRHHGPSLKGGL